MTKLLILSDSHNSTGAVERILHAESDATAVIFLGDGLRDLEEALTLYPKMKVYAVAGNCDFGALEPLDGLAAFDQVVVFYTHRSVDERRGPETAGFPWAAAHPRSAQRAGGREDAGLCAGRCTAGPHLRALP